MPGPADHGGGGVPELLAGLAQAQPHVRLPDEVPLVAARAVHRAQFGHRLAERRERLVGVGAGGRAAPVLDGGPPTSAPGRRTRPPRRAPPGVEPDAAAVLGCGVRAGTGIGFGVPGGTTPVGAAGDRLLLALAHGERVGGGQVDEADRDPAPHGPAIATHSGENSASGQKAARPGSSTAWASSATGGTMPSVVPRRGGHRVGLGRAFDQHDTRLVRLQHGTDRPGRTGAVVPDPQQQRTCRAPCAGRHADTSRQAR